MKLIDKLLMRAKEMRELWQADVCVVFYEPELEKWVARVSAVNNSARESLSSDELFEDMDSAVQFCEEFISKYEADATIIINDIIPGGEVYGKGSLENDNSNGG